MKFRLAVPAVISLILTVLILAACDGKPSTQSSVNPYASGRVATFSRTSGTAASTPEPTVDLGPGILLQDDFSDPKSGWEVSSSDYGLVEYENGRYKVESYVEDTYNWCVAGIHAADVRIDVDVEVAATVENGNDAFGVDCRVQENGDGYGFRISSDGYIGISKYVETKGIELQEWITSDAVYVNGRTNHLTAICQGDHVQFLVNNVMVAEVIDDTFASGDIGFSALTFEPGTITVFFDNIIVQEVGNPYLYSE